MRNISKICLYLLYLEFEDFAMQHIITNQKTIKPISFLVLQLLTRILNTVNWPRFDEGCGKVM